MAARCEWLQSPAALGESVLPSAVNWLRAASRYTLSTVMRTAQRSECPGLTPGEPQSLTELL